MSLSQRIETFRLSQASIAGDRCFGQAPEIGIFTARRRSSFMAPLTEKYRHEDFRTAMLPA
jgi:hypothetical protein